MSLFQNTIVAKYLQTQSKERISNQWSIFQAHFHNPDIQENIRNSKEEQYQGGFIMDLFVNILGYTKNPIPDFNITTEYKNVKDSKKVDGAIIFNKTVKAVIELKGTNTTDLNKIETQAFGYKNNQPSCSYIVTSNFEKLRFYIDNAIEHIEFNLFTLTQQQFELLYLCLAKENIENDIPKKLKEQSISQEDAITKNLYKDYSFFKRELHQNLVLLNPDYDALTLFKKSQKLLDRFLFLFFAEDRQLLPPNSVRLVLKQWKQLKDLDEDIPLYNRFKKYFSYLNTGFKGKQYNVYAYNGGLFKADAILDSIVMDDDLLYKHSLKLSEYDFASEVDVNILGHIFENSLTEMEGVQAELEGQKIDKTKTKRKKDGVFYTPKYITKYIVENTVGKLCEEKKLELQIDEDDYSTDKKRQKKTIRTFADKLTDYRNWLLQLTICDPACGSGAFLNQALDFLIKEHSYIDELQAKLFGDAMVLSDVEKSILENNLFGVDLNEESVEIAKLSLWLRTAQSNRKLNDLNNNIKCGNSLIDDPDIAGNKAFNWTKEFPQIFKEIDQKIYHVTTAIHDSRTSNRMVEYKVRERRDMGTNPYPNIIYFTKEDDLLITQTIADIAKEDDLKILAYNICADHIHLLLVCDMDEIPNIMQKIKGRSSFVHNNKGKHKGLKPLVEEKKQKNKPLWQQKYSAPKEVTSQEQFHNTINYIQNNRHKHGLPAHSKTIENIIDTMCCDIDTALKPKYIGGFDVVIGNPPYVRAELLGQFQEYFSQNYTLYNPSGDLFSYFYEKSFKLLKADNGLFGFISNTFDKTTAGISIREYLQTEISFLKFVDFTEVKIFEGATTYPVIIIAKNVRNNNHIFQFIKIPKSSQSPIIDIDLHHSVIVEQNSLEKSNWSFKSKSAVNLISKLKENKTVREIYGKCNRGIVTGFNEAFIVDLEFKQLVSDQSVKDTDIIKKIYEGKDLSKWSIPSNNKHIIFSRRGIEIEQYPVIKKHLEKYRLELTPRTLKHETKGRKPGKYKWFEIQDSVDYYKNFEKPKIVFPNLQNSNKFSFDETGAYINAPAVILPTNDKFLLAILNSKLVWYFLTNICVVRSGGYIEVKPQYFEQIPIPEINNQDALNTKTDSIIAFTSNFKKAEKSFTKYLQSQFNIEKLSRKLQNWHKLEFPYFIKELNKAIKKATSEKLTKKDEMEWMELFDEKKAEIQTLKIEIEKVEKEIDQMVYQLYGLTDEEIAIVEAS